MWKTKQQGEVEAIASKRIMYSIQVQEEECLGLVKENCIPTCVFGSDQQGEIGQSLHREQN